MLALVAIVILASVSLACGVGLLWQRRAPDWLALSVVCSGWALMLVSVVVPITEVSVPVSQSAVNAADVAYYEEILRDGMRARAGGS